MTFPSDALVRALDGIEHDPNFELERFLAGHPNHAGELRARIAKLQRHGMLRSAREGEQRATLPPDGLIAGRYRVVRGLGRGGMGQVLLARDERLGRDVAIKLAHAADDGAARARLEHEARLLARLEHPGIVALYDGGSTSDGRAFCAMRVVGGRTVHEVIASGEKVSLARKVQLLITVCDAVGFAHARGIVHRDLKPANVMVGMNGDVQVVDWGLAKERGEGHVNWGEARVSFSTEAYTTIDGCVVGTPNYCAPEQARGELGDIDERTDVFGLGAILHHLLTGRPPYFAPTRAEILERARTGRLDDPELARAPERVPPELVSIFRKACAAARMERYASAGELGEELRAFLEIRTVRAYRTGTWAETSKWLARNRGLAIATVVVVLAMAAGTVVSTLYARQAHAASAAASKSEGDALKAKNEMEIALEIARSHADGIDEVLSSIATIAHARAHPEEAGSDDAEAGHLTNLAEYFAARGRYDDAVSCQEAALVLARGFQGNARVRVVQTCMLLAKYRRLAGQIEAASTALVEAEQEMERTGIHPHPHMGFFLNERAVLRRVQHDFVGSAADYGAVLALLEASDAAPSDRAIVANNLVTVLLELDRLDEARGRIEDALAAVRAHPDVPLEYRIQVEATAGVVAMAQQRWSDAEPLVQFALEQRTLLNGPDARETLQSRHNWGRFLLLSGDLIAAETTIQDAHARQLLKFGQADTDTLSSAASLAELRSRQGRYDDALRLCRSVRPAYEIAGPSSRLRSLLRLELDLLVATGDLSSAKTLARMLLDLPNPASDDVRSAQALLDSTK